MIYLKKYNINIENKSLPSLDKKSLHIDVDLKLVPQKENTEHGLEVRKIY